MKPRTPTAVPARRHLLLAIALVLEVVVVYARCCQSGFVNWDDETYITLNPHVGTLSSANIQWAFTTLHAANWHPLTWLSLQLDGALYGGFPFGYHLDNLLWHTANTLLLYLLLWRMTGALYASAMVATLFALHPLHVESVAWISERKDVLSTACLLLCLHAYVRYARQPHLSAYLPVCLWLLLGLLAKPMLVSTPLLLLLLDFWPLKRWSYRPHPPVGKAKPAKTEYVARGPATSVSMLLFEKIPLLGLVVASAAMTMLAQYAGGAVLTTEQAPAAVRLGNASIAYTGYLVKMICPAGLMPFYPYPSAQDFLLKTLLCIALLVGVTIWSWRQRQERPYVWVGWSWYVVSLVPVIGLVQVGSQAMADRYTYVPAIGLFLAAVWLAADLGKRLRIPARQGAALASLVLVACAALTIRQIGFWHDSQTLWRHALAVSPDNYMAHYCLGLALAQENKTDAAIAEYRESIRLKSDQPEEHYALAKALAARGDWQAAIQEYRTAIQLKPGYADAYNNWGALLLSHGKTEPAIELFNAALATSPSLVQARVNLGIALLDQHKYRLAADQFVAALAIQPDLPMAENKLGLTQFLEGNPSAAIPHYQQAIRLNPGYAEAHTNLGMALVQLGRVGDGVRSLLEALRLNAHDAWIYGSVKRAAWDLATNPKANRRSGDAAIELGQALCQVSNNQDLEALDTLAAGLAEKGRFTEAAQVAAQALSAAQHGAPPELAHAVEGRLRLYQSHQPYRDEPAGTP